MFRKTIDSIFSTKDIPVPKDEFERIIGQDNAIRMAKVAAKQRRHLLLVGPPGVGKSMIARAISSTLPSPKEQIVILHNPSRPERPILKIERKSEDDVSSNNKPLEIFPPYISLPIDVAEKLNIRCKNCGHYSAPNLDICPKCSSKKRGGTYPFYESPKKKNYVIRPNINNEGEAVSTLYFVEGDRVFKYEFKDTIPEEILRRIDSNNDRKVLVPFDRSMFVQVVAKTESELFGDVEHDPYGTHPELGTPHFSRVVAGAVHEAHEGVLFIDELSTLEPNIQRALLTAMQDKKYPIVAKNTTGTGAVVKVENVPCDFILVGAINILDLPNLHPALRSRINGYGYEVVLNTWMPITDENIYKTYQFVAQEIANDNKIPHFHISALYELINVSKRIAKRYDKVNGLTLRFRYLGGIVRAAGDLAVLDEEELVLAKHVLEAEQIALPAEEQLKKLNGNWWRAVMTEYNYSDADSGEVR